MTHEERNQAIKLLASALTDNNCHIHIESTEYKNPAFLCYVGIHGYSCNADDVRKQKYIEELCAELGCKCEVFEKGIFIPLDEYSTKSSFANSAQFQKVLECIPCLKELYDKKYITVSIFNAGICGKVHYSNYNIR